MKFIKKCSTLFLAALIILSILPLHGSIIKAVEVDELVNVALGGTISATHQNNSYPASNAIDGIISKDSYWDSGGIDIDAGEKAYLILDLQKEYDLENLKIYTYPGNLWAQTTPREYRYTVAVSNDKQNWDTVGTKTAGSSTETGDSYDIDPTKTSRYVRIEFDGSNSIQNDTDHKQIMHLLELQAFAKEEPEPEGSLQNIAKTADFTFVGTSSGYAEDSICDGNLSTLWATNSWDTIPTLTYTVPKDNTKPIRKITLDFEGGTYASDRMVDITLEVLYKGEIEKKVIEIKEAFSFLDQYRYEFEGTSEIDQIYVTLSNPTLHSGDPVLFTPAFAEVGIYVDKNDNAPNMSKFVNIASQATVTPFEGAIPETDAARLVDKDYSTLFTFHKGAFSSLIDKEVSLIFDLGKEDYDVNAFEIAFEKAKSITDTFHYTYSIYTQKSGDENWVKRVDHANATRLAGDNMKTHFTAENDETVKVNKVKVVIDDMTATGWPSLAEFKIFAVEKLNTDGNLAFNKAAHTNTNQANSSNITDGKPSSKWTGIYYPGYVDIDLEKNYNLDEINIYLPTTGYSQYDIYTSLDGVDFTKLYSKTNKDETTADGDVIDLRDLEKREARIVRVYVNYQSGASTSVSINEVKIYGEESGTKIQEAAPIEIADFEDTEYAKDVTNDMIIEEVQGIITRQIGGQYVDWFRFEVKDNSNGSGYDYFNIIEENGKIHIIGNNGVSLATGLNHYLKYYLNVNISQVGNQVSMPDKMVSLQGDTIYKETKMPVRYAYNYCTHSYSMPFWGEEEWRNELDWLALNGVNIVLDMTGQEEVWREFLNELGYSQDEAKDFIAGPAYYAWAYMANLSNYGGPVHNTWFSERVDLARKNQFIMRKLGMKPILQGYSGMVPTDIETKDTATKGSVITQGTWNGFQRPSMLKTTDPIYNKYAKQYYEIQKKVFGDITNYYATDPFHEGGITGGMDPKDISEIVLDEMIDFDKDAVWVIQSWQKNPTPALLEGIGDRKEHALILDLWAEKDPRWDGESSYGYTFPKEFGNTPWVWCLLNNFGGRPGLKGYMDVLFNDFPTAYNETNHMAGIGITPEASYNNPVIYDLFFELIWVNDASKPLEKIDKDEWINDYITRRYGAASNSAKQAWDILNDTVYNSQINNNGEGPVCSVINARPNLDINNVSCCDSTNIKYDKEKLEQAANLLVDDYAILSESEGYQYDLSSILLQILANTGQEYQKRMSSAIKEADLEAFKNYAGTFMDIIDETDVVASTQDTTMVGTWIEQAKRLAKNADEFSKELYEFNARSLISTWGSKYQANSLHDYSNRQWSGLTKDLYKKRWQLWIDEREKELKGEAASEIDWFEVEWEWANSNNEYTTEPTVLDMESKAETILSKYSVTGLPKDPAEDNSRDVPVAGMKATSGSEQTQSGSEGPASNLLDGNISTLWHSVWSGTDRKNLWVNIALEEETLIDGIRYLPRTSGTNGIITKYKIEISKDHGATYQEVATGNWVNSSIWKAASFEPITATDLRISAVESVTDSSTKNYASGAELRITAPSKEPVDKSALQMVYDEVKDYAENDYTTGSWTAFKAALDQAAAVLADESAAAEQVADALTALNKAKEALVKAEDMRFMKSLLKTAMDKAEVIIAADDFKTLAPNVQALIKGRLNEAAAVYKDEKTTLAECKTAWQNLAEALHYADFKADKTMLKALMDECEAIDTGKYTEASVKVLTDALSEATKVYEDQNALQERINAAYDALKAAKDNLSEKPVVTVDKSVLSQFIDVAKGAMSEQDKYLKNADWDAFVEALANAENVYADEAATQEAVNKAAIELSNAYLNIRYAPSEEMLKQLEDFIDYTKKINRTLYSTNDLKAIDDAANKAQELLNMKDFDVTTFNVFTTTMGEVMDIIEKNKIAKPIDKNQNKNNDKQNGVKAPGTSDTTNTAGTLLMLLAGCGVMIIIKKRKSLMS